MMISDERMWQATVECDGDFDGEFFYAVKTVGVYCRPSCKSRTPLRKNVEFFATCSDAENSGFRPCKRCRPDIDGYSPVTELAARIKQIADRHFCDRERLKTELSGLGLTSSHASVIFKKRFGLTPAAYVLQLRQEVAARLLTCTDMRIIDVADESGFGSLSAFNALFKKRFGSSPSEYRLRQSKCLL